MFRAREQSECDLGGPVSGVAALSYAQLLTEPVSASPFSKRLGRTLSIVRARIETLCQRIDLAPDLAEQIGTRRWFRGLATLLGLCALALACWPDLSALEAATATPVDGQVREEFRSQMIMPLGLGGDSGRHMGATALVVPIASVPERPRIAFAATLGQGDSFGRMLQRAGVGAADAAQVATLVAGAVPLDSIAPGTRVEVTLGQRGGPGQPRVLEALDFQARLDLRLAISRQPGGLALSRQPIAIDATPLRIRGTIGGGLYRSARAAGAPVKAIQQYLQALDQHLSLEGDIAPGDQFDMIVDYRRSASGESVVGGLVYAALERAGRSRLQLLRWGNQEQLYEASGIGQRSSAGSGGSVMPVNGRMTSPYGLRRHPILGYVRMHAGIDFGAAWGSPIFAVSDGMVSFAGRHGGHGNYVRIEHGGGLGSGYGHMSRIAVSPGATVRTGQVIGYVGSSGLSTGPHLHFEVYRGGQTVNPLSVSFAVRAQVDQGQLAAFQARLAQVLKVSPGAALRTFGPRQAQVRQAQVSQAPIADK